MKPASSLFVKIIAWFFLNMLLVAATLALFFVFQPRISLFAIFDQQGTERLRTAGLLIVHDLGRMPRARWADSLARHAAIHGVDFSLVLENGSHFSSAEGELPGPVTARIRTVLRRRPPKGSAPPPHDPGEPPNHPMIGKKPPRPPEGYSGKPHFMMRTRHPVRYWSGHRIQLPPGPGQPPSSAVLLAGSDSLTGNGFFFNPVPWIAVFAAVILISILLWIPMVRSITRPLSRMTRATEEIAKGRFDASIHEVRTDEIGRLARAINHMSARLSAFVKGQKRFLGDVAHELGSPIARIQFGLGALEQRVEKKNRPRVNDVMEDVDHMTRLVNELLCFSRAEMNAKTVELDRIDLLSVVQAAVQRETSPTADIAVRIEPGLRVVASSELLTRALANLLRNAVKYAANAGPISVSAHKRNGAVEVEVRDAGAGVPEGFLDQLFEPFFRPETSRDRDSGGVGLGLAIVKTCVETCNGTVAATNLEPKGFAVAITLKS